MWSPNSFPRQRDISNDKTIDLPCITTNKCPISYQTLTYHISSNNAGRMPLKQTKGCTLTIINPDRCFLRVHGIWKSVWKECVWKPLPSGCVNESACGWVCNESSFVLGIGVTEDEFRRAVISALSTLLLLTINIPNSLGFFKGKLHLYLCIFLQ